MIDVFVIYTAPSFCYCYTFFFINAFKKKTQNLSRSIRGLSQGTRGTYINNGSIEFKTQELREKKENTKVTKTSKITFYKKLAHWIFCFFSYSCRGELIQIGLN